MPKGVYKRTEEHRNKLKVPHKGSGIYVRTDKTKISLSNSHKGVKLSESHKKKIGLALKGAKSYWWKGGIYPEIMRLRRSSRYKTWHKECLKRDGFTDQKTGQKGGKLEVHHINNFADFPELRFDIANGVTFSKDSHRGFHKKYGKINNTKEQLIEFLKN